MLGLAHEVSREDQKPCRIEPERSEGEARAQCSFNVDYALYGA